MHHEHATSNAAGPAKCDLHQAVLLSCLWEVTAPKPGNVHRGADFEDVTFGDFATSAVAIGPVLATVSERGLGRTVLDAVQATRRLVKSNTNLGIILLEAPIAMAASNLGVPASPVVMSGGETPSGATTASDVKTQPSMKTQSAPVARSERETAPSLRDPAALKAAVTRVLDNLTSDDSRCVYEAIRLARPGGLGEAVAMDVVAEAPGCLLEAMRAAAERDMVARQYATGFEDLFQVVVPELVAASERTSGLERAIVLAHVRLMSRFPDSLIARKCGVTVAAESASRATAVMSAGEPFSEPWLHEIGNLDFWLRSDGHRRNPGTTADLIAAGLFVSLLTDQIQFPAI